LENPLLVSSGKDPPDAHGHVVAIVLMSLLGVCIPVLSNVSSNISTLEEASHWNIELEDQVIMKQSKI